MTAVMILMANRI